MRATQKWIDSKSCVVPETDRLELRSYENGCFPGCAYVTYSTVAGPGCVKDSRWRRVWHSGFVVLPLVPQQLDPTRGINPEVYPLMSDGPVHSLVHARTSRPNSPT